MNVIVNKKKIAVRTFIYMVLAILSVTVIGVKLAFDKIEKAKIATIAAINIKHARDMSRLKTKYKNQFTQLKKKNKNAIKKINMENKKTITKIKNKYEKEIKQLKQKSQKYISNLKSKNKEKISKLKINHDKKIAQLNFKNKRNITKTKMKERSKRIISGIPIVGTVFLLWAGQEEYAEYEQWLENNSGGTIEEYAVYKQELLFE